MGSILSWLLGGPRLREPRASAEQMAPNRTPPVLNPGLTNSPMYPLGDYWVLANQGYSRNELIYAGMRRIMDAVSMTPLRVYTDDDQELPDHPLRELVRRPNPFMGEHLLWELTILNLYLAGSAFLEKVRDAQNRVVELWPLRPDRVKIIPDNKKYIAGYIYEIAGLQFPLDTSDIVHFKFPNPVYDYFGLSPLVAALRRMATDNELTDFTKTFLQNYATPSVVVTTTDAIDQDTVNRLSRVWRQRYGDRNRGMPAFLQSGMDIKAIGLSFKDLAFPELDATLQKRVLVALGISPILLGQEATYANYAEARASFYEDTIEPLQARLDDRIENELLFTDFGDHELQVHFDNSEVSALRPVRQSRWDNALKGVTAGVLSVNRALAMVGEQPVPGGDVYLRPIAVQAVPAQPVAPSEDDDIDDGQKGVRLKEAKAAVSRESRMRAQRERYAVADAWAPKFGEMARRVFGRQARSVIRVIDLRRKAISKDEEAALLAELAALEREWDALAQAEAEPIMAGLATDSAVRAAAELGISFDLRNPNTMAFIRDYSYKFAHKISHTSAEDVRAIIADADEKGLSIKEIRDQLEAKFADWDRARADLVARNETIRAANAGAVQAYKQAGITRKIWIADSDPCPYCAGLSGMTIEIDRNFLSVGDSFQPGGAERPMEVTYEDISFPPAHPNCRCTVGAEVQ